MKSNPLPKLVTLARPLTPSTRALPRVLQVVQLVLAAGVLLTGCTAVVTPVDGTAPLDGSNQGTDVAVEEVQDVPRVDVELDNGPTDAAIDTTTIEVLDIQPDVPCLAANGCCNQDADCASTINAKCQTSACVDHKCQAPVLKPGANVCCTASDCMQQLGEIASCDVDTATCVFYADFCEGKAFPLAKVGWETKGNFGGFTPTVSTTASNSSVKWQISSNRSHTGKSSMYFGNDCDNYDTSAATATSCQVTGAAAKVVGTLSSPEILLPKDSMGQAMPAMLHYWVWIAAEPMFLTGNPGDAGTSCKACAINQTCVNFGGGAKDACLTEKDALSVYVNGSAVPIWSSTKIGKSTDKTKNGGWEHRVINLAGFGAAVNVSWVFDTVDGLANGFEGVYMDDVVVETLCATNPSTSPATTCDKSTACSASTNPCAINACTFYDNVTDQGYCFADLAAGCCAGLMDCADGNSCTIDACNAPSGATTGICSHAVNSAPPCCLESNLFADDCENGISAWTSVGSNSTAVSWRVNPTGGVGGSKSLAFTDATFQSYADPTTAGNGASGTICSPEVQLQSGTLYDVVAFQLSLITAWCGQPSFQNPPGSLTACVLDTDCTAVAGETCNLVIGKCAKSPFLDKLTVTFKTGSMYCGNSGCKPVVSDLADPLWTSDQTKGCNGGNYADVVIPLDKFAGKKGRVCFTFGAGDAGGNNFAGPNIDNFSMDIKCTSP